MAEREQLSGGGDEVLDAGQLVRIEATHRGFTYQGLYAVACFLLLESTAATAISLELDEDIELQRVADRIYVQVKSRGRALGYSDIEDAISRFAAIRAEHVAGRRTGIARFAIVSNRPPGVALKRRIDEEGWPVDVAVVWPGGSIGASDLDLPVPQSDLAQAVEACVELAGRVPFSNLLPMTIVLKLFGYAQYLSTGQEGHTVAASAVHSLLEQLAYQIQDFPEPPPIYLTQESEPDFASTDPVKLVVGVSGAGKTSWASFWAPQHPHPAHYFDVGDLPGSAVASSLARELAAKFLGSPDGELTLRIPAGSGLEVLKFCARRIRDRGLRVTLVLDNVHRISGATVRSLVEATNDFTSILLAQPWSGEAELEATLQIRAEHFNGWSLDQVSVVFARCGCRSSVSETNRVLRLTGGVPLYVNAAARLAATEYGGETGPLLDDLEQRTATLQTVQEVLLAAIFAELEEPERKIACLLEMVEVPLEADDIRKLAEVWNLRHDEAVAATRQLVRAGVVEKGGQASVKLHDAFRLLARDHEARLGSDAMSTAREAILAMLMTDAPAGSPTDRVGLLVRMLALTDRHETLVELATMEEFHQLGSPQEVRAILERVASHDERPNVRFWALDALAFWDHREQSYDQFALRVSDMEQIDDPDATSRETAALAMKQVLRAGVSGDRGALELQYAQGLESVGTASEVGRLLRYNYALALHLLGCEAELAATVQPLVDEYLEIVGLKIEDLFLVSDRDLRSKVTDSRDVDDHLRHLADCLYLLAVANYNLGGPAGLGFIHAMKLYLASGSWDSAVKSGQDAADEFVRIGDVRGARKILEDFVLPVVVQYKLIGLLIPTRAQHAVLIAWDGEIEEAREELRRLSAFEVSERQREELANQQALVEQIADNGGRSTPPSRR